MPKYNIRYKCPHTGKTREDTMFGQDENEIHLAAQATGFTEMQILGLANVPLPAGHPNEGVAPMFDPFADADLGNAPTPPRQQPPQLHQPRPPQPTANKGFTPEAYGRGPVQQPKAPVVPSYEFEENGMQFKVENGIVFKLDWVTMEADTVRVVEELPEGDGFKTKVFRGKNPVLVQKKEWKRCGK